MNNYLKWFLLCCCYSIFKLFYESGGDIGRYYRPFEEFSIHLIVIIVVGLIPSGIYKIFSKKEFSKILIWTTLIMGVMIIMGGVMTDREIEKRNQTNIMDVKSEINV